VSNAESDSATGLIADLEKLPPIFPPRTLAEWSRDLFSERRLGDMRKASSGPAFIRVPGGRQIIYTRAAVADWLKANISAQAHA